MNVLISIIVPVYNSKEYINKCLDSILNQSYENFEVILINDGSTDNSLLILEEYETNDKRIKVFSIDNAGQGNARNVGLTKSSGEYIAYIDSDDHIEQNYLELLVSKAKSNSSDLIVCKYNRIFEKKSNFFERNFDYSFEFYEERTVVLDELPSLILSVPNSPWGKLFKTDFLVKNKIEFPVGLKYEDATFTQKVLSCNPKIDLINNFGYNYIIREGSLMTSYKSVEDMFVVAEMILQNYKDKNLYEKYFEEINYYIFNHVALGQLYRGLKNSPFKNIELFEEVKRFLRNNNINLKNNKYLANQSLLVKFIAQMICASKGV